MATIPVPDALVINITIGKTPTDVQSWQALAIERRKEYNTIQILKAEIEQLKARLAVAGIP